MEDWEAFDLSPSFCSGGIISTFRSFEVLSLIPFLGTSLVVQWLGIHLSMQGTQVRALVREGPTCHGATKRMHHNY
ncbi:hypothetical protein J1605_015197 [Eschrichtius robustus]|uniref:Uncharacterized protein n=1 Tax=Eschrichtius robustus TaxID=9764 RepID=A0AB34GB29_ESCRO|nr:hypothetical protein J1605_015197 [Eschrichtius robustus]